MINLSFGVHKITEGVKIRVYDELLSEGSIRSCFAAAALLPERFLCEHDDAAYSDAYHKLMALFLHEGAALSELNAFGNALDRSGRNLQEDAGILYYRAGELMLMEEELSFKSRAVYALPFFRKALETPLPETERPYAEALYLMSANLAESGIFETGEKEAYFRILEELRRAFMIPVQEDREEMLFSTIAASYGSLIFISDRIQFLLAVGITPDELMQFAEDAEVTMETLSTTLPVNLRMKNAGRALYDSIREELTYVKGMDNGSEARGDPWEFDFSFGISQDPDGGYGLYRDTDSAEDP